MKNCILTPTYEGHFKYIKEYLSSYNKYVNDPKSATLCFVLSSKDELEEFNNIIESYRSLLDIDIYIFDEILKFFDLDIETDEVLRKYGHTSYQMMKKFYSMLYINADRFLVLDSEAVWIKEMSIESAFDNFFDNPFIVVSNFETRRLVSSFLTDHFDATNYILGYEMKKMPFEHFIWFYKKEIIQNIIDKYGTPYDMMIRVYEWEMKTKNHSVGLMETMLCLNYIYENSSKLGYRIIQAEDELIKYLGKKNSEKYIKEFFLTTGGGQLGLLEFPCDRLNCSNIEGLSKLFVNNNIYITRCDYVTLFNKAKIEWFLRHANISILAVGQDHIFLPNISESEIRKIIMKTTINRLKARIKILIKEVIKLK